jgi:hypothetical protein
MTTTTMMMMMKRAQAHAVVLVPFLFAARFVEVACLE